MASSPLASPDPPPLAGLRVVCAAVYVPALVAARRLRDAGAEVAVVVPPGGDPLELVARGWYDALHRGCATHRLDLKAAADAARFDELLAGADVLVTAFRPSALDRLGLDWASLHARHPSLCHVAITGFAPPDAEEPGHDLTYQARAGLLCPQAMPRTLLADLAGGERAALAATALLLARERGGGARRADVSLAESATSLADPLRFGLTASDGILGGALPGYGLYAARDGWVALAALEPHFWLRLGAALGVSDAALDRPELERIFAAESADHWERWAREHALPLAAVRDPQTPNDE